MQEMTGIPPRKSAGDGSGGIPRGYHAVIQGNDPVHASGELAVVRGDDEGLPQLPVCMAEVVEEALSVFAIQISGRFIGQNDGGIVEERAGECDALAFAARQFGRVVRHDAFEAEDGEKFPAAFFAGRAAFSGDHAGDLDVFDCREIREQVVKLENEADFPAAESREFGGGKRAQGLPFDNYFTGGGMIEAAENLQERRLPRAGNAEQGDHLSPCNGKGDILQNLEGSGLVGKGFFYMLNVNHGVSKEWSVEKSP